jgi:hypothetical protein
MSRKEKSKVKATTKQDENIENVYEYEYEYEYEYTYTYWEATVASATDSHVSETMWMAPCHNFYLVDIRSNVNFCCDQ